MMPIKIPKKFKFLFRPLRYKISYGGRGAAKSESYAIALLLAGIQNKERILCCREFQASIKDSVKSLLDRKIDEMNLSSFYSSIRDSIRGRNGTEFIFAGIKQNASKIKSTDNVTKCWVEEGQTISQDSLDILIPTIRAENSEIWVSMNTGTEDDPMYSYFIKNEVPDSVVKKVNYYDNPFFPEVLRREMEYCKQHDYDKYLHVWEGECVSITDACVFKNKYKIDRFEAPKDTTFYLGLDLGFSVDPLAFIRCYIDHDKRMLFIDKGKSAVGVEIDDTPAFLNGVIPDCKNWMITVDSARPEIISHLRRHGFRVRPSKKGAGSVVEGVEYLKNFTIIIHESLKSVIHEFMTYSYKIDKHTNDILPILEDKNDHFIDALRYATEALRRPQPFMVT